MKSPKIPQRSPKRIIIFATLGAVLVILAGTIFVLGQAGIGPIAFAGIISETVSRLAGANLTVTTDQNVLPADGKATTAIHVESTNPELPVTATIVSGGGSITVAEGVGNFTYTAGTLTGNVELNFSSGSLNQSLTLTLEEAIVPATPILVSPADKSSTNNHKPEVSGTGPANTKILITDNGNTNTTTKTDDKGSFRTTLEKPLYGGQHTLAAIAVSPLGVASVVSNLATITVKAEPVKVDTNHIRLTPAKPVVSNSFGLFVPASLNTERVVAELEGQSYELFDLHKTSVFTGTLPAPDTAGSFTINLTLYDLGGTATKFDKAISFISVSQP